MLHPDDIARLCQRKYPAFLRSVVTGEAFFPLEIRFGRPSTTAEWETLRREITALAGGNLGYCIDWDETNTRRWGRQKFPRRVWFADEASFLRALGKAGEGGRFRANLALTRERCPELEGWLPANAPRVVEFSSVWPDLLKVCRYFLAHPRPGLYARELPIAVDTKFVERHETILRDLLDFLLPESARTDADRFAERFGLRFDEALIRFRLLDPSLRTRLGLPVDDLSVPLSQFRALGWPGLTVIVTENKMTFLTLPPTENALGIWGGGGAAELLTAVTWLARGPLYYWGDLDVHGFHILSRLRRAFPALTSLMMNESTLDQHAEHIGASRPASYEDVAGLTEPERRAYRRLLVEGLLLEQEKIPHPFALLELQKTIAAG